MSAKKHVDRLKNKSLIELINGFNRAIDKMKFQLDKEIEKNNKPINDKILRCGNDIIIVRKKQGAKDWFELCSIEPEDGDRIVLAAFDTLFWNGLDKELQMSIIDKAVFDYGGWY